jgi:hypothetical protein
MAAASIFSNLCFNIIYPKIGIMIASETARPKLTAISAFSPLLFKAKPPLRPIAINRYKDKNRDIGCGISRFDFIKPAKIPKIKNKIEGSSSVLIGANYN